MKLGPTAGDRAALAVVTAVVGWITLRNGFYALSDDDFARVVIAQRFSAAPSLDPSGTSWLPFPFWLTGGAMRLLFPSLFVARGVAIVSNVAAVLLVHQAAALLGLGRRSALAGAVFAVLLPTAGKLGVSFQPEALTAGLVVFAAAATQVDGRHRVAGGLALAFATLSRYEAWPVAAAFSGLCVFDAIRKRPGATPAAALALAGPVAWLLHGVFRHGDALFFVRRVTAYRRALGGGETWVGSLLAYPYAAFRAEPVLCTFAVAVLVLSVRGALRPPPLRRFPGVMAALFVFLAVGRLMDGAPTHHDERPLLPIFWGVALLAVGGAARLFSAMPSGRVVRTAVVMTVPISLVSMAVQQYLPADPGAPRADERAIGDHARQMTPGAFLVVDTPDYGYFAVIAAFSRARGAEPLTRHDPREGTGPDLSTPDRVAAALRGKCPFSTPILTHSSPNAGRSCAYVVHESHAGAVPELGTVAVRQGPFVLVRGR